MTADSETWLGFLAKERGLLWAFVRGEQSASAGRRSSFSPSAGAFRTAGVRHEPTPIRPNHSRLRADPVPYRQNDAATGKIKWSGALELAEIIEVAHNVKTFRLVNPAGGEIPFEFLPGQFLTLAIEPSGVPTKRSYTIASSPTCRDWVEITVKREERGLVSRWLHDAARPGDFLMALAPNGTFTFTGEEEESIVLIGGGVGLTPLMSVTRYPDRETMARRHPSDPELPQTERVPVRRGDRSAPIAQPPLESRGHHERSNRRDVVGTSRTHR